MKFMVQDFSDDKQTKTFLVIFDKPKNINGTMYFQIVRVWTRPDNKGKGYVTRLHLFVLKKLGFKLISDYELTDDGKVLYKNIVKKKKLSPISFFNSKTKELTNNEPPDLWVLDNDWLILMEENSIRKSSMFGHKSGYGYLQKMIRIPVNEDCV